VTDGVSYVQDDDTDTSVDENVNMFHANYQQMKENPVYSSDPDIPRRSSRPVETPPPPDSDSTVDEDDGIVPTRRPLQQLPNYRPSEVWTYTLLIYYTIFRSETNLILLYGDRLQKSLRFRHFKWNLDEIWQDVLQVNTHRLMESDFRFDVTLSRWRPLLRFTPEKCCHLVSEHETSARLLCSGVRQFLIYGAVVLTACCTEFSFWKVRVNDVRIMDNLLVRYFFFGGGDSRPAVATYLLKTHFFKEAYSDNLWEPSKIDIEELMCDNKLKSKLSRTDTVKSKQINKHRIHLTWVIHVCTAAEWSRAFRSRSTSTCSTESATAACFKISQGSVVTQTVLGGLNIYIYPPFANLLYIYQNYESWLAADKVIAIIKQLTFLSHPVYILLYFALRLICFVSHFYYKFSTFLLPLVPWQWAL